MLELGEEEVFDEFVLDVFVLGEDGEDEERREGVDLLEVFEDSGDLLLFLVLGLGEVFQGLDPEVGFLVAVCRTQI